MEKYLAGEDVTEDEIKRRHPQGHPGVRLRADPVRLGVQEQGRAADARRRHRLPAEPARHPARPQGTKPNHEDEILYRKAATTSRSPRWRSRSSPTRSAS